MPGRPARPQRDRFQLSASFFYHNQHLAVQPGLSRRGLAALLLRPLPGWRAFDDNELPALRSPPPLTADDNARDNIVIRTMSDPEARFRKAMAATLGLGAGYQPAKLVFGFSA